MFSFLSSSPKPATINPDDAERAALKADLEEIARLEKEEEEAELILQLPDGTRDTQFDQMLSLLIAYDLRHYFPVFVKENVTLDSIFQYFDEGDFHELFRSRATVKVRTGTAWDELSRSRRKARSEAYPDREAVAKLWNTMKEYKKGEKTSNDYAAKLIAVSGQAGGDRRKRTKRRRTTGGKKSRRRLRKRTTLKGGKRKRRRTRRRR
jgi:hypothetical protein